MQMPTCKCFPELHMCFPDLHSYFLWPRMIPYGHAMLNSRSASNSGLPYGDSRIHTLRILTVAIEEFFMRTPVRILFWHLN